MYILEVNVIKFPIMYCKACKCLKNKYSLLEFKEILFRIIRASILSQRGSYNIRREYDVASPLIVWARES